MKKNEHTIKIEDKYSPLFFNKISVSIERGEGIYVWDEDGKKYIDLTSGWGVTCLGHSNLIISNALMNQSKKIIQNPNSGATYSPNRAQLLSFLQQVLPNNLSKIFFTNSGAESNDVAIKLARKISGKLNIISTNNSFHGRTISTLSATGQPTHRDRFKPLMPNYSFIPFNDIDALRNAIDNNTAAFIVEPIQGEGGVNIPAPDYIKEVSKICFKKGIHLIIDEIQTGFCRTGSMFAIDNLNIKVDFLTLGKGIAGGFPFGAVAITPEVSKKIEIGDHGGTYCGNPLGCAVAREVIKYLFENKIPNNVEIISKFTFKELKSWRNELPNLIADIRGKGLLIAIEFYENEVVEEIKNECLQNGLILNVIKGKIIRIIPALNITLGEMKEALNILRSVLYDIKRHLP